MTTINKEEIQKFSKLANEWWDVNGKFKPLHLFNPIRIEYIKDKNGTHYTYDINTNTNYNSIAERKVKDKGMDVIAKFLNDELKQN